LFLIVQKKVDAEVLSLIAALMIAYNVSQMVFTQLLDSFELVDAKSDQQISFSQRMAI